ncbi:MAG: hypothetical protein FJ190_04785 [Gammaproteobacteria bacterium]|nr:hypothetical protein [Gammaproteobacteria bacterium]
MKKIITIIQIIAVAALFSSAAFADDDDWDDDGYGRRRCDRQYGHQGWGGYPRQQVNNYYPQPQANYYYEQPPVTYYQPQPQYYPPQPRYNHGGGYYDNRSHQGLAGSVIGDVIGYELGNGHPLAAGIGAAAGSFLGNGMGWRY